MSTQEERGDSADTAGPELFQPKKQPKVIRVLTVLAYILSVSMAAILLSIYYIFMWHGEPHIGARTGQQECMKYCNCSNATQRVTEPHLRVPNSTLANLTTTCCGNISVSELEHTTHDSNDGRPTTSGTYGRDGDHSGTVVGTDRDHGSISGHDGGHAKRRIRRSERT